MGSGFRVWGFAVSGLPGHLPPISERAGIKAVGIGKLASSSVQLEAQDQHSVLECCAVSGSADMSGRKLRKLRAAIQDLFARNLNLTSAHHWATSEGTTVENVRHTQSTTSRA